MDASVTDFVTVEDDSRGTFRVVVWSNSGGMTTIVHELDLDRAIRIRNRIRDVLATWPGWTS